MSKQYSNKRVRVWDNGLYLELARRLAQDFAQVEYYVPWESQFPKSNITEIGSGIEEITKILDFWDNLDSVDLFVFPDIYSSGTQILLESLGKRVWGSRRGEDFEIERVKSKKYLTSLGINIGEYDTITGISNLRAFLKDKQDVYVKVSRSRGDTETFHCENYSLVEPKLTELEWTLGAKKELYEFLVERAIEGVEISYDGYCVDGEFAYPALLGIEIKGKCYVGVVKSRSEMPSQVVEQNDKLSEPLRLLKYRNFLSPESRMTPSQTLILTDPCCRMPSTGEAYPEIFSNISDIIWKGAEGELVEPECKFKFVAELDIFSPFAGKNPALIQFPQELRSNLKFRNLTVINKEHYVIPQGDEGQTLCGVVALGDSLSEATERCKEYAKQVKGYQVECPFESFDEAAREIEKLESFGVKFI